MLHWPIHATIFFLNLAYVYSCKFDFDGEVMEGLLSPDMSPEDGT
jgi:hypothetical protein